MARFQSNRSSCGPAALHNALEALGISRSEDELITLCKQTPDGTAPKGIISAIRAISSAENPLRGVTVRYSHPDDAIVGLWWNIQNHGRPTILCVDNHDHWVVCAGFLGNRFVVIDSADNRLILHLTPAQLLPRWVGPGGGFYGIVV